MSDQIFINIAHAEAFKEDLRRTKERACAAIDGLSTARLASTWRDEHFARFEGRITTTKRKLEEFSHAAADIARHLDGLIQSARDIERHQRN
jgi:hypothetical protein